MTYVCRRCNYQFETLPDPPVHCGFYRLIESGASGPNRSTFAKAADVQIVRHPTSIEGFDKVLSGGIVHGTSILLGGQHGAGKSTLAVMVLAGYAELYGAPCLYASAEESVEGVLTIVKRAQCETDKVEAMHEGYLPRVIVHAKKMKAQLVAFDSFNRFAESPTAEKAAVQIISKFVRETKAVALIVNQLTKDGAMKGGTDSSHGFDVEMFMGAPAPHDLNAPFPSRNCDEFGVRILYTNKNRRGALGSSYWEMHRDDGSPKAGSLYMVPSRPPRPIRKKSDKARV